MFVAFSEMQDNIDNRYFGSDNVPLKKTEDKHSFPLISSVERRELCFLLFVASIV